LTGPCRGSARSRPSPCLVSETQREIGAPWRGGRHPESPLFPGASGLLAVSPGAGGSRSRPRDETRDRRLRSWNHGFLSGIPQDRPFAWDSKVPHLRALGPSHSSEQRLGTGKPAVRCFRRGERVAGTRRDGRSVSPRPSRDSPRRQGSSCLRDDRARGLRAGIFVVGWITSFLRSRTLGRRCPGP
jgi:hypothetical protein